MGLIFMPDTFLRIGSRPTKSFTPDDITSLIGWLRADALVLNNNDPVSTWTATTGGNATQGTGAYQPLFKTNIQNSKPAVLFDGTDDALSIANTASLDTDEITIFLVVNIPTAGSGTVTLLDKWAQNFTPNRYPYTLDIGYNGATGAPLWKAYDGTNNPTAGSSTDIVGATKILTMIRSKSGNSLRLYINGALDVQTTDTTTAQTTNGLPIGLGGRLGAPPNRAIAAYYFEIIIYSEALSTANHQLIEAYLNSKYAIY